MTPFSIKGLDHVVLRVTDLERSLGFYRDVLGCKVERELEELGLYQLRAGNHLIDLVVVGSPIGGEHTPDIARKNQDHFCLTVAVSDSDAQNVMLRYLSDSDVPVLESGERYGAEGMGWSVYVSDPDQNTVELKLTTKP